MSNSRIPEKDSDFDQYLQNTNTYNLAGSPVTNGARLGLAPAEISTWTTYRDQWVIIYPQYTNANTRTKTITNQKNTLKASFKEFAMPLLDRIAASSAIAEEDRSVYNLPLRDTTPTPRGVIADVPYVNLKAAGGGMIEVRVRTTADASRASRHPLADAVEVRYKIVSQSGGVNVPQPLPGSSNDTTPPATAADCPNTATSKKALFRIEAGQAHSGKKIYCFVRWANLSNPANSGPWSEVIQAVIV
jgi:hypothetical protein